MRHQVSHYAAVVSLALLVASCASIKPPGLTGGAENATDLTLTPVSFSALPNWQNDTTDNALVAFKKSCGVMMKRPASTPVAPTAVAGTIANWQPACTAAVTYNGSAKQFFESYFQPYQMTTANGGTGLFTGYYQSMLQGSPVKTAEYNVPLYKRPSDLVMVELGEFRPALKGQRIAGRVLDGKLKPYESRAQIERGALAGKNLELIWVNDADAAFFVQVQGSGRVQMTDGSVVSIGYDGQNGHAYNAIGRELIARGELTKENVSLQTINAWLKAHPSQAQALRDKNPSYVFFKKMDSTSGAVGAQGVALTPMRSLAVDPRFVPYGAPVFLDINHPTQSGRRIDQLLIAQDTGGAIRGPVRGDMFWGIGPDAEAAAGVMKSRGSAWMLLPKTLSGTRKVQAAQ
jgi:membrane-bound lytic murein transglycosylase A